MHTQEHGYTCGRQCVCGVLACYNDVLFLAVARLNAELWVSRLHILYSEHLTITFPLHHYCKNEVCTAKEYLYVYVSKFMLWKQNYIHVLAGCFLDEKLLICLCDDCLTKEVLTCDRCIYYANYTFKSTRDAIPILESAVITSTRTVFAGTSISTQNRCFHLTDLKCHAFGLRENVCLVLKVWIINLNAGMGCFFKSQLQ